MTSAAKPQKTSWLMLVIVVLLLGLCAAGVYMIVQMSKTDTPASAPPEKEAVTSGTLQVTSTPDGALVFVNGRPYGKTPALVSGLPLDEDLTLRIEKQGFEVHLMPVHLTTAKPQSEINAKLRKP